MWIAGSIMLFLAYVFASIGCYIPNIYVYWSLMFFRWLFQIISFILLLKASRLLPTLEEKKSQKDDKLTLGYYLIKAQGIRAGLLQAMNKDNELKSHYGDIIPLLDKTIEQIKEFIKKDKAIGNISDSYSLETINKELTELKDKESNAINDFLKKEINTAIGQQEKLKSSLTGFLEQKEIIYMRVTSAISTLEKLKIDSMQIKNIADYSESAAMKELREKTEDISHYMEDFKQSIAEFE